MGSRLLNVRVDEDRVRKARRLREHGIALSDLVREAIDERFDAAIARRPARDVRAIIAGIFERYPDPPGLPARTHNVHDRRAARRAILARLRRKRR